MLCQASEPSSLGVHLLSQADIAALAGSPAEDSNSPPQSGTPTINETTTRFTLNLLYLMVKTLVLKVPAPREDHWDTMPIACRNSFIIFA